MQEASDWERHCVKQPPGVQVAQYQFSDPGRVFHFRFAGAAFHPEAASLRAFCPTSCAQPGDFLPAPNPPSLMRHDHEIEYIPLDGPGREPRQQRGFLRRLLGVLGRFIECLSHCGTAASSGEEVEEEVIEF